MAINHLKINLIFLTKSRVTLQKRRAKGTAAFGTWHEETELKLLGKLYSKTLGIAESRAKANWCSPGSCSGFPSEKELSEYIKWDKAYAAYRAETKSGSHFDDFFGITISSAGNVTHFVPKNPISKFRESDFDKWYSPNIY